MTHSAVLMLHLTGLRPVNVLALMDNLDTRVDVVDAMIVTDGQRRAGQCRQHGHALHTRGPGQELVVQVYCDRGWVDVNISRESCTIYYEDGSAQELPPLAAGQSYQASAPADNLVDVIVRGAPNMSPPETGWRTVELLDAAYRSAANEGRRVQVSSLYEAASCS